MAGKRAATTDLNHDNWDEEEEAEEAGTFKVASKDILQKRVIKTAKRRGATNSGDEKTGPNVFSSFTGFAKPPSSTSTKAPMFSFLAQPKADTQNDFKNGVSNSNSTLIKSILQGNAAVPQETNENKSSEYYAKLKGLNESVSQWIKQHVDANPICILTPIFRDYEKYLKEIEELKPTENNATNQQTEKPAEKTCPLVTGKPNSWCAPTFGAPNKPTEEAKKPSIFSFTSTKPTENVDDKKSQDTKEPENKASFITPFANTAAFSFSSTPNSSSSTFSFGAGKPFTFTNVSAPPPAETKDDDEDEPPKVEFTPVVEEGNIYNTKCKLFVKKDAEFVERGVGQLYLKPIEGSEKTQLIVRADTNLGNLLMNVVLTKSIPTSRKGKNHVMIICVPTPEEGAKCKSDQNPLQTLLIKVKNGEEADKLFEVIEKHKN